jgi:ribonuclease/clavin/mitogillin
MEPSGIESVAHGVERASLRTPTLPPATRTNTYVLGHQRLCVVDPAPSDPEEQRVLLDHLVAREKQGARVTALVLTHHHADHVGATTMLRDALQVPVLAHEETAKRVDFVVENRLNPGDALPTDAGVWVGVFTPGHAAGHLCFHRAADGALVCGDMLAGFGTILVDPEEGSMSRYMDSLRALEELDPAVIFPAHGPAMAPGVDHVRRYLAHRSARADAIVDRLARGDRTPAHMVPHIYAGTPDSFFPLAERSVLAMLIMLEEQGRVRRQGTQWISA